MKLEVRKAADGTWHWRRVVNGRVTAHGADYNSQAGATRGLLSDMFATWVEVDRRKWSHDANAVRAHIRKSIQVIK